MDVDAPKLLCDFNLKRFGVEWRKKYTRLRRSLFLDENVFVCIDVQNLSIYKFIFHHAHIFPESSQMLITNSGIAGRHYSGRVNIDSYPKEIKRKVFFDRGETATKNH